MRHFYIQAAGQGKLRCICVVWVMWACNGLKKQDCISAMLSHTAVHRSDEETVRQHCLTPGTAVVTVIHNTILMSPKCTAISSAPCRVHKHTPSLLIFFCSLLSPLSLSSLSLSLSLSLLVDADVPPTATFWNDLEKCTSVSEPEPMTILQLF